MDINEKLDLILESLAEIRDLFAAGAIGPSRRRWSSGSPSGAAGDFIVRKDPPRWEGPSYVGHRLSDCPPDYLETWASFRDWQASRDAARGTAEGDRKAAHARKDAARARGWARQGARKGASAA